MSLPAYLRSNPDPLARLEGDEPAFPPTTWAHRPRERPPCQVGPCRAAQTHTDAAGGGQQTATSRPLLKTRPSFRAFCAASRPRARPGTAPGRGVEARVTHPDPDPYTNDLNANHLALRQVEVGQLPGPAGLLQRAMERGLTISSLSDLVPGSRPSTSAGVGGARHREDPDFDSPAWVSAVDGTKCRPGCPA